MRGESRAVAAGSEVAKGRQGRRVREWERVGGWLGGAGTWLWRRA